MDISYYYQILDIGILYEKGKKEGRRWKIGERKRLCEEVLFWQSLLGFILDEQSGMDCSGKLFESLEELCKKYYFPNYERVLAKKDELLRSSFIFKSNKEEELNIYDLMSHLMLDIQKSLHNKDKEKVYKILTILHNLPKAMHGNNILNERGNLVSCKDALTYAQGYMDEEMKEKYKKYF